MAVEKEEDGAQLVGTLKLFCMQKQVQEGIYLVLAERLKEYKVKGLKYKPNETTVVNELLKRGIEMALETNMPLPTWKPFIYRTVKQPKDYLDKVQRVTKGSFDLPDRTELPSIDADQE